MTARTWRCPSCRPIVAHGSTDRGPIVVVLHGVMCDQPLLRRRTLVYRITKGPRR